MNHFEGKSTLKSAKTHCLNRTCQLTFTWHFFMLNFINNPKAILILSQYIILKFCQSTIKPFLCTANCSLASLPASKSARLPARHPIILCLWQSTSLSTCYTIVLIICLCAALKVSQFQWLWLQKFIAIDCTSKDILEIIVYT
jgi:hypothetical protein